MSSHAISAAKFETLLGRVAYTPSVLSETCHDLSPFAHVPSHRAQVAKLEQQLHDGARVSHAQAERPCAWANVSQPAPAVAHSALPASTASSIPSVTRETERVVSHGRRISCPDSNRASSQAPCKSNRSAVGDSLGMMRLALEQQQQAATVAIARDTRCVPPSSEPTPVTMTTLRSIPPSSSKHESPQRTQQQVASSPGSYSLTDFIAAGKNKKPSRKKAVEEESERSRGPRGRVWAVDVAMSADDVGSDVVDKGEVAEPRESLGMGGPMGSRKSFSEIIAEEERDKKERDEYGDNAWFVSRKPRSTSFETIIQQQRREEKVAQEEKTKAVETEMEQEMLRLVLQMSMHDVQPGQSSSRTHGKPAKGGRKRSAFASREAGSGTARQRKGGTNNGGGCTDSAGSTTASQGHAQERVGPTAGAGAAKTPRENSRRGASGPNRRPKHSQNGAHGETPLGQVVEHRRKQTKLGTSV